MTGPVFVRRVARIPAILALVAAYPDGLTLGELADRFGTSPATLREDLTAYVDLESWGWALDIFRRSQVELLRAGSDDGDADDDAECEADGEADGEADAATVVRVVSTDPAGLGVEHLSAGDLAVIYTAGAALHDVDPDADLAGALRVISETMYGESLDAPRPPDHHRFLPVLREALTERRRARIVYSRAWREGVLERTVEPLRLMQTQRGWELDAGPVGEEGRLRTYLLTHVRDVEVLDEAFDPPGRLDALLAEQRRTTTVRLELAQDARWAADVHAERVRLVEDREETFVADLDLLPPVGERVGLLLLASGPDSRVVQPVSVLAGATALIEELLAHHEG